MSNVEVCDSTPHPGGPSALDKSPARSAKQLPPTNPDPLPENQPEFGSPGPGPIHVLATFATQAHLLAAFAGPTGPTSWVLLGEASVRHALAPPLSHIYLPRGPTEASMISTSPHSPTPTPTSAGGPTQATQPRHPSQLRRLDDLSLDEAKQVIRRLADELEDALNAAGPHAP